MEDSVTPAKRHEAIERVAEFLRLNYPCSCPNGETGCDDLDEACAIVEIVEEILIP